MEASTPTRIRVRARVRLTPSAYADLPRLPLTTDHTAATHVCTRTMPHRSLTYFIL